MIQKVFYKDFKFVIISKGSRKLVFNANSLVTT